MENAIYETQQECWADGSVFATHPNQEPASDEQHIEAWKCAARYLWAQAYFLAVEGRPKNAVQAAKQAALSAEKNTDKVLLAIFGQNSMPEQKIVDIGKTIAIEDAKAARAFVFEYTKEKTLPLVTSEVGDKEHALRACNGDFTSTGLAAYMATRKIANKKELLEAGFSDRAIFACTTKGKLTQNRKGEYVYIE